MAQRFATDQGLGCCPRSSERIRYTLHHAVERWGGGVDPLETRGRDLA